MSENRSSFHHSKEIARRTFGYGKVGTFVLGCWVYLETKGETHQHNTYPSTRSLDEPIPSYEEIASELTKHEEVSFYDQTFSDDVVGFEE